jgi:hypothetical protein
MVSTLLLPFSVAILTAISTLERRPSLARMLAMWLATVPLVRTKRSAISSLLRPDAINSATSRSRRVIESEFPSRESDNRVAFSCGMQNPFGSHAASHTTAELRGFSRCAKYSSRRLRLRQTCPSVGASAGRLAITIHHLSYTRPEPSPRRPRGLGRETGSAQSPTVPDRRSGQPERDTRPPRITCPRGPRRVSHRTSWTSAPLCDPRLPVTGRGSGGVAYPTATAVLPSRHHSASRSP